MRREQFYNKYGNNKVSAQELERKYKQYLYEQEMMQLSRATRAQATPVATALVTEPEIEPFVDPDYVDDDYME